jgi:hypothetical protein
MVAAAGTARAAKAAQTDRGASQKIISAGPDRKIASEVQARFKSARRYQINERARAFGADTVDDGVLIRYGDAAAT